ncbi:MAG: hypothetical protein K9K67_14975 [Bacteriovoracaceae bacterium]|nr:hypothetical protein [Bacteriovoracaceae bacterium]
MTIVELKKHLNKIGAIEGYHYVIDALGDGDVHGIASENGKHYTYYSERGNRHDKKYWSSEDEACEKFISLVTEYMKEIDS